MLKTISVAMAVYNGGKYLPSQIDSILDQFEDNDELIVSYDKSLDDTFEIICNYSKMDDRVKVVINDHPGVVGNFNTALSHCAKDAIFISDQDDIWVAGKRKKMLDALNSSKADLAIHNVVHIDSDGKVISKPLFQEYGIREGLIRNFLAPRYSGCCMAFPSKARRFILPLPQSVVNYDHWIGMVCEFYGKVVFVDEVLLEHRLHGENVTTSRRPFSVIARQRLNLFLELVKRRRVR